MGEGNAIHAQQFKDAYYLWEAKMLNPYIEHGTLLMEFDDHIKTI
jgi:hypothetical protein